MATSSEAIAPPVAEPAPTTAPAAPVVDTPTQSVGPETVVTPPKASVVTAFKKFSADDLEQLRNGIGAKLSDNPRVGRDATLNAIEQPKTDTPSVDEPKPETAPETAPVVEPVPAVVPDGGKTEPAPETLSEEEETEVPAPTGKTPQQRLRAATPLDDMALTLYRKANAIGKKMTLGEAEAEAKRILGDTAPTKLPPLKSVEIAQGELKALREQRKAAKAAYDDEAGDTVQNAIEDKLLEIEQIRREGIARQQAELSEAQSTYVEARTEAAKLYPALLEDGKEGRKLSEMSKAAAEIHNALVASGDPSINEPDYLLDLARRAAKATSTPPYLNGKTPVKTVPRPTVQPAKPQAPLLSPSARTTQTSPSQNLKAAIGKASPRQLDALVENLASLTGRH